MIAKLPTKHLIWNINLYKIRIDFTFYTKILQIPFAAHNKDRFPQESLIYANTRLQDVLQICRLCRNNKSLIYFGKLVR